YIGDWLVYGEGRWGQKYKEAIEITRFDYQTLANDKTTALAIPPEKRRKELSFSHYALLTKFDEEEQDEYIEAAIQNNFSVKAFSDYINHKEDVFERDKFSLRKENYVSPDAPAGPSPEAVQKTEDNLFTIQSAQSVNTQL